VLIDAARYAWSVSETAEPNSPDGGDVVARAATAYRALADLAETIEDEWQYVTDLVDVYLPGIQGLAGAGPERLGIEQVEAVDEAIAEIGLISDPHKAIDWLSTFPHVVGLALGGDVDRPAGGEGGAFPADGIPGASVAADAAGPEPDDDSPFRLLLGRDR
jgi:hypothetical protein